MFKYFTIVLMLLWIGANSATAQVLCFKSEGSKGKYTRLQLTLPGDGSKLGTIRYESGLGEIVVERIEENILSGRKITPAVVRTEFAEIIDGKRVGTYLLISQGAIVGELSYKKLRKGKVYKFYDDQDSSINDSCTWATKNRVP